jgi:hypothetical protein
MARETPETRVRYLDFLRLLAIGAVMLGHWLMAAVTLEDGDLVIDQLLAIESWTKGATWVLQVMPVFFFVGGWVNAASWESAQRRGTGYGQWLFRRAHRLLAPAVVFSTVWAGIALILGRTGLEPGLIEDATRYVGLAQWFLAVYVIVVIFVPLTTAAHRQRPLGTLGVMLIVVVVIDAAARADVPIIWWGNFAFVWMAVHQLGYFWRDGRFDPGRSAGVALAVAGLAAMILLTTAGPYPVSMVGAPGDEVTNTYPPTIVLFALGVWQLGLAVLARGRVEHWLQRTRPWTAVIAGNAMVLTVFLWHLTAMVGGFGLLWALDSGFLRIDPGTAAWWLTRLPWFAFLALLLAPLVAAFLWAERMKTPPVPAGGPVRVFLGTACLATAMTLFALEGFYEAQTNWGINWWALGFLLSGEALLRLVTRRPAAVTSRAG